MTLRYALSFIFLASLTLGKSAEGAPRADHLLPSTTKAFLSIESLERVDEHWRQSQFGRLAEDEAMQPFVEDLTSKIEQRAEDLREKLGLSLSDLEGVASGEVALAVVWPGEHLASIAILADVEGREARVNELLRKLDGSLSARGATKQSDQLGETKFTLYTVPPDKDRRSETAVAVFVRDDVLCVANRRDVAEGVLARFAPGAQDRLADLPAYRETLRKCLAGVSGSAADLHWFIEPFGFTFAYRELEARRPVRERRRKDIVHVLQRHGFDAIEGIGGLIHLHPERGIELVHRTAVYAPHPSGSQSDLAMQLLRFPVAGDLMPQRWVPADVATFVNFHWNVQHAFDHVGPLADDLMLGKDNFATVLEGIAEDRHGPQVDIRNEIVAHLGTRITVITDYELPITTQSEQFLFAIESTNDDALADSIRRLMETDKWKRRHEFHGHLLWQTVEEPLDDPVQIEIEDEGDPFDLKIDPFVPNDEFENMEANPPKFPNSTVAVANGHLWWASDMDFLKQFLTDSPSGNLLAQSVDFARVESTMRTLAPESLSLRSFSRTDQEYRPTYELLRQGLMPQSKTLLGRILNEILAEDDEQRQQKMDASKLPPFDEVEQYFGPAGMLVSPQSDGWFIVGAMLSSSGPEIASKPE